MIDLEKIKNDVAVKHGYNMWLDILGIFSTSTDISYLQLIELENEVATEFAKQMCDELEDRNKELTETLEYALKAIKAVHSFGASTVIVNRIEGVLNTSNVVKP